MSNCNDCVHLHRKPMDGTCDAYSRIPHGIWSSDVGHNTLRGDEDRDKVAFKKIKRKKQP